MYNVHSHNRIISTRGMLICCIPIIARCFLFNLHTLQATHTNLPWHRRLKFLLASLPLLSNNRGTTTPPLRTHRAARESIFLLFSLWSCPAVRPQFFPQEKTLLEKEEGYFSSVMKKRWDIYIYVKIYIHINRHFKMNKLCNIMYLPPFLLWKCRPKKQSNIWSINYIFEGNEHVVGKPFICVISQHSTRRFLQEWVTGTVSTQRSSLLWSQRDTGWYRMSRLRGVPSKEQDFMMYIYIIYLHPNNLQSHSYKGIRVIGTCWLKRMSC